MPKYQIVDTVTGRKVNIVEWDGETEIYLPEGQRIEPDDGAPVWQEEAIAPPAAGAPDGPTNSDWRVGLILWGRFAEVEAKVIQARDSGTVEGQIAWQRWEYANNVYRGELMMLKDAFGFTAEDVEESLRGAAQVAAVAQGRSAT